MNRKTPPPLAPFHRRLFETLQAEEPKTWKWFSNDSSLDSSHDQATQELLKQTVRLDPEDEPHWYDRLEQVANRISFDGEVTLYRGIAHSVTNASVYCLRDHTHIVLHGDVESLLDEDEQRAMLGHELGHALLTQEPSERWPIADAILAAWSGEDDVSAARLETMRLFQLYNELWCDRLALQATESLEACISLLIKSTTGSKRVHPKTYLKQAREVVEKDREGSRGTTHPENYLRAAALERWHREPEDCEEQIERWLIQPNDLESISLLDQVKWRQWTHHFLFFLTSPEWRRTAATEAHLRLFCDGELPKPGPFSLDALDAFMKEAPKAFQNYGCYLMLDFATVDLGIQEPALAQSMLQAREWGCEKQMEALIRRELRWRKSQVVSLFEQAEAIVAAANTEVTGQSPSTTEGDS